MSHTGLVISLLINLFMAAAMTVCLFRDYYDSEKRRLVEAKGRDSWRFFTTLSNVLAAVTALIMAICEIRVLSGASSSIPHAVFLLKFIGTTAVMVTLLTVFLFLSRKDGLPSLLGGQGLYLHLIGPVLAFVSFCFLELAYPLSFAEMLLGLIPTALYGAVYMVLVVVVGQEKGGWPDFYHFTEGIRWQVSMGAMLAGTLIISLLTGLIHNLMMQ